MKLFLRLRSQQPTHWRRGEQRTTTNNGHWCVDPERSLVVADHEVVLSRESTILSRFGRYGRFASLKSCPFSFTYVCHCEKKTYFDRQLFEMCDRKRTFLSLLLAAHSQTTRSDRPQEVVRSVVVVVVVTLDLHYCYRSHYYEPIIITISTIISPITITTTASIIILVGTLGLCPTS